MKPLLLTACWCMLLPLAARGHVGSPNVFFEGEAGPYPLRVIIRPPGTLPGIAHVDVRVTGEAVTNVSVQAALWEAGIEAAPAPVLAMAVAGENNLFNTALWLLRAGSYRVRVVVEGQRGRGTAVVPLNAAATQRPAMSQALVTTLVASGIFLFAGIVWLAGATARDSTLEPGATPTAREHIRARAAMLSVIVLLATGTYACALRWRTMDREFRNRALYKPVPAIAGVRTNGTLRLLRLTPENPGAQRWDTLVADHGKLMHLFLLRDPDFNAFAHLHPVRRDAQTFENVLPPLPAGFYRVYAEITHESGLSQTLTANVSLPATIGGAAQIMRGSNMLNEVFCLPVVAPAGNAPQPFALDADDSWHASPAPNARVASGMQVSKMMNGYNMVFQNTGDLIENRETSLRFAVFTPEGPPAKLQLYMGMLGHAVVRRADGQVFTHLHPIGNISMAAQELFLRREFSENRSAAGSSETNAPAAMRLPANAITSAASEVAFPYAFPRRGDYRLWVQVRTGGRVLTGVFDMPVKAAP